MINTFNKILAAVILTTLMSCSNNKNPQLSNLVDFVNPLMGTDSKFSLSNGNTYPRTWLMCLFDTPQSIIIILVGPTIAQVLG